MNASFSVESTAQPVVKHHALWVQSQDLKKRRKKQRKQQRKKVSSVKLGRNKDESNLSEENNDQDDHTAFVYEDFDATAFVTQMMNFLKGQGYKNLKKL
ncbi:hypothetical protein Tco_1370291, partial [Tanacetum coccineum]